VLLVRFLAALALVAVGASAALAATLVHQHGWGLTLGLAAAAFASLALPGGVWRFAFMLGWFGAITYALMPRTEGDYLIAQSGAGYGLLGGSFLLLLVSLATLPPRGSRHRGRTDDPPLLEP
jgi:hypothetical protein